MNRIQRINQKGKSAAQCNKQKTFQTMQNKMNTKAKNKISKD